MVTRAEAPSSAARRLAERNRLAEVEAQAQTAREAREAARATMNSMMLALQSAQAAESAARELTRRNLQAQEVAQANQARALRESEDARLKLATSEERIARLNTEADDISKAVATARNYLAALPDLAEVQANLAPLLAELEEIREKARNARAARDSAQNGQEALHARLRQIVAEQGEWQKRAARAGEYLAEQDAREEKIAAEMTLLTPRPDVLRLARATLATKMEEVEAEARAAADGLAQGESVARQKDNAAREALHALSSAREALARAESAQIHADERLKQAENAVLALIEVPLQNFDPHAAMEDVLDETGAIEQQLLDLKSERERLGIVNLRAEIELQSIETTRDDLAKEREEITKAVQKFRRAIESLNAEGRARLKTAFGAVNTHFTALFTRLFGGGEAELQLVEADDPLEAGLEIIARPPGKKPQLLTLLSGGEQALTATALIFAVFLTNPAPICVLDEVDAPLDDANVERLCALLRDMARETQTRFLVITHNPISMAQMDRLYGVTMVEQGVSQIVSVDLAVAESLAEAG